MATHQWKLLKERWLFKMTLLMKHMQMKRDKLLFKVISMYRRSLRCCNRHVDAHVSGWIAILKKKKYVLMYKHLFLNIPVAYYLILQHLVDTFWK